MGKKEKAGKKGPASNYITRTAAIKKLQITLKDFRRLCILKGIYPRDPKKKLKGKDKTYYHKKDILFLSHEPLLAKFREFKTFLKRHRKAVNRREYDRAEQIYQNKPSFTYDHLVRERFPTFLDAIRDMDDCLSMIHLFAVLPAKTTKGHKSERAESCLRLCREFQNWVVHNNALRKVFVSIKGYYYQAEIQGQKVTWLVPHNFSPEISRGVDYRVMLSFLDFYETSLKFINFKLYHDSGLHYPPKFDEVRDGQGFGLSVLRLETIAQAQLAAEKAQAVAQQRAHVSEQANARIQSLKKVLPSIESAQEPAQPMEEASEPAEVAVDDFSNLAEEGDATPRLQINTDDKLKTLFKGCTFLLSREVPKDSLELVVLSAGGKVIRDEIENAALIRASRITHQVVDRPLQNREVDRHYVQPQWVYDSFNMRHRLPVPPYAPGATLPPHLSPFVDDEKEGYVPEQRNILLQWTGQAPLGSGERDEVAQKQEEDEESQYSKELARERAGMMFGEEKEEEEEEEEESIAAAEHEGEEDEEEGDGDEDGEEEEDDDEDEADEEEEDSSDEDEEEDDEEEEPVPEPTSKKSKVAPKPMSAAEEAKELSKMMMGKKAARLYSRMQYGINQKSEHAENLQRKALLAKKQAQQQQAEQTQSSSSKSKNSKRKTMS
eukprot:TRINITY_DN2088_c0_g2_i2.p1 TRINITY_DN2088_c0_g2~~TRINITY_DN2088_c0_g2_i2.p1  ORF type:complete len:663 (+),score=194.06 TRINITY_DN2088_c0_g2_i2:80-2068(+)